MKTTAGITMYSTDWCSDCRRAKRFLSEKEIDFEEINIDEQAEAAELVIEANGGRRVVPTFLIEGKFYGNPPLNKLADLVGAAYW